jgi:hypothetical protein
VCPVNFVLSVSKNANTDPIFVLLLK